VRLWLTPAVPVVVQEVVDSQIRARLMGAPYTQMPATPTLFGAGSTTKSTLPSSCPRSHRHAIRSSGRG
jgi:hypothetical protein